MMTRNPTLFTNEILEVLSPKLSGKEIDGGELSFLRPKWDSQSPVGVGQDRLCQQPAPSTPEPPTCKLPCFLWTPACLWCKRPSMQEFLSCWETSFQIPFATLADY